MHSRLSTRSTLALVIGAGLMAGAATSSAFDMGNMMNPSKWMGGDRERDRYDDRGWDGPGYGGPGPWGAPYGYGAPGPGAYGGPGGYPAPGGYGAYPGPGGPGGGAGYPGQPARQMPAGPSMGGPGYPGMGGQSELELLKERVRALEGREPR